MPQQQATRRTSFRRALKSLAVSDLVEAASESMGIPTALVERSAAARAAESDSSMDDILAAWAGGEAPPAPAAEAEPQPAEEEPEAETAPEEPEEAEEREPAPATVAVMEAPEPEPVAPVYTREPEPEEPLEPVPLSTRVRTAARVGSWTGAALGLVGFLIATAFWAPNTAVVEGSGPVVQVDPSQVLFGVALVSVVFGAVVASLSRAAASSKDPAMQLSSSRSSTGWIGAAVGLVLGAAAGAVLATGVGTPIEGSEEGLVQLPVLATLAVMLIGGAVLGGLTSVIPQLLGTPIAVEEGAEEEIDAVKTRLGNAMSIPIAAAVLLVVLVLPFGYLLIESNHLGANGAAIVAILTAGGILGFASLAGSKPEMRISFGELMVAVAGIGTVLIIIVAVLFYTGQSEEHEEDAGPEEAAVVSVL